jgi:hypothetical protein
MVGAAIGLVEKKLPAFLKNGIEKISLFTGQR